ncbi:MAG TPA: hypothetical protein VFG68_10710 [Fimbriiglobus sp.]|nr:hypothetical protein [Fimbriiglobus sp.]
MTPDRYHLNLEAIRDPLVRHGERPRPIEVRLRALLKYAVRACGFKIVAIRPDPPHDTPVSSPSAAQVHAGSPITTPDTKISQPPRPNATHAIL